jgi:hypothetical protein
VVKLSVVCCDNTPDKVHSMNLTFWEATRAQQGRAQVGGDTDQGRAFPNRTGTEDVQYTAKVFCEPKVNLQLLKNQGFVLGGKGQQCGQFISLSGNTYCKDTNQPGVWGWMSDDQPDATHHDTGTWHCCKHPHGSNTLMTSKNAPSPTRPC